jgi:hypothetical protein
LADAHLLLEKRKKQFFLTICRIPVRPFDYVVKTGQVARLKTVTGEIMTQYLVAIQHPDNFDPSTALSI